MIEFHRQACEFLDGDPSRTLNIAWVPGHQDVRGNDEADELAKAAVELGSTLPGSRANAIRRAKGRAAREWKSEWERKRHGGHFAAANRLPPPLNPTKRFKETSREVFGRVLQTRTGHGYTGEFYNDFLRDVDSDCPCGEFLQTRQHILAECPQYEEHRHLLREASRDLSLPVILGTTKGIAALTEFIAVSGAFTKTGAPRAPPSLPTWEQEPEIRQVDENDEDG